MPKVLVLITQTLRCEPLPEYIIPKAGFEMELTTCK